MSFTTSGKDIERIRTGIVDMLQRVWKLVSGIFQIKVQSAVGRKIIEGMSCDNNPFFAVFTGSLQSLQIEGCSSAIVFNPFTNLGVLYEL